MDREILGLTLFGEPVFAERPRGKGRPAHAWSQENSHKISLLFAVGGKPEDAADALDITMPTLRKHYFSELRQWKVAGLKLRAKTLLELADESGKGNVAAAKELLKQIQAGSLIGAGAMVSPPKAKAAKPGKKEQALDAARSAGRGGKWADLLDGPAGNA